MPFTTTSAAEDRATPEKRRKGSAGSRRMKEISIEEKTETDRIVADLVSDLKRPATAGETIEAELIASVLVKSRRLRLQRRDDSKERRMLRDLMRSTVFGSVPAPPRVTTNIFDGPRPPGAPAPEFRVAERGEKCLIDQEQSEAPTATEQHCE